MSVKTQEFLDLEGVKRLKEKIEEKIVAGNVTSVNNKTGDVVLTKNDIGLNNVENKSSATIRGELTTQDVAAALGYTPEANVQSDWNQTDNSQDDFIKNKPTIPTKTSELTNDSGFLTSHQDISGKANKTETVSNVAWDNENRKITQTINGATTDIVSATSILNGAEENQNAFSNIKIDSSIIAADSKTDTLEFVAGSNITLLPDTTNDKITISSAVTSIYDTSDLTPVNSLAVSDAVSAAIAELPEPMVFKGTLGTNGTISTLPEAAAANNGHTYKVITAGTYASQEAKIGDIFISNGSAWTLVPSGDEPSGTVTNVAINNGDGISVSGGPITTSGTITVSHADTSSQASSTNSGRTYIQSIGLDGMGHVISLSTGTETVTNTTYTFGNGTNGFTVTPSGGTAQTITVTPSVSKSDVGLGNVDNTSDLNKPVSTATQTALNNKLSINTNTLEALSNITGTARIGQFSENIFNTDFENDDGLYMFIPWSLTSATANQGAFMAWDDESASMYHGWCDNEGNINSYKIYDDFYHPAADNKLPLAGGTMTGNILTNQTIRPTTSGSGNIGTSSYRFGTGYINTLNSTTVAASSNVTIGGNNAWHAGNLNFSLSGTTLTITTS